MTSAQACAGKVAFITGAARGQGRSHAVAIAWAGGRIAIVDIADQIPSIGYPMFTRADLDETVRQVEAAGGACLPIVADVRDIDQMNSAVKQTLETSARNWADAIGVLLTGVYNTIRVVTKPMIDQGEGGSIVITSSLAGLSGMHGGDGGTAAYTAAKHGVVGLMRGYAKLLGRHNIRVNTIHPMGVATPMVINPQFEKFYEENPDTMAADRLLPIRMLEAHEVTSAVMWLISDAGRAVTGICLPIDAGISTP
jgi:NAD(P)-dependent dehydrogenase (short-subunit alcohol dehydrogenase family)